MIVVSTMFKGVGQPTLVATGPGRLSLFARDFGRLIRHFTWSGTGPWVDAGGVGNLEIADLPTAVYDGANPRVYARAGRQTFEATLSGSTWTWRPLSASLRVTG